jgi:small multidrug resistance family-3 protein
MTTASIYRSIVFFLFAGLCEIGGGYLVWNAVKGRQELWAGILGGLLLVGYGVIAAFQTMGFGRTYAIYGGVFVLIAVLWGYLVDKIKPDTYDIIGAAIIIAGTAIIFFAPRQAQIVSIK